MDPNDEIEQLRRQLDQARQDAVTREAELQRYQQQLEAANAQLQIRGLQLLVVTLQFGFTSHGILASLVQLPAKLFDLVVRVHYRSSNSCVSNYILRCSRDISNVYHLRSLIVILLR